MSSTARTVELIEGTVLASASEAWRAGWLTVASNLRKLEGHADVERAKVIERIVEEGTEALERDRVERERLLLEETGTVAEVASRTGLRREYLHSLIKKETLKNYALPGQPSRLRYSDVWALRKVPLAITDHQAALPSRATAANANTPHRVITRVIQ